MTTKNREEENVEIVQEPEPEPVQEQEVLEVAEEETTPVQEQEVLAVAEVEPKPVQEQEVLAEPEPEPVQEQEVLAETRRTCSGTEVPEAVQEPQKKLQLHKNLKFENPKFKNLQ